METEKQNSKLRGVLSSWDEIRGFGFVVARNPDGTRRSWFLHCTRIERIEVANGIPEAGSQVLFNEEPNPKGPLAVDAEILARAPQIQRNVGLVLSGKIGNGCPQ
jgi:cold shock CspA family protein